MSSKVIAFINCGVTKPVWGLSPVKRTKLLIDKHLPDFKIIEDIESFSGEHILLLRDDVIYEASLLAGMASNQDTLFINDYETPVGGYVESSHIDKVTSWIHGKGNTPDLPKLSPQQVGESYRNELRKKSNPFAIVVAPGNKKEIEWFLFQNSYKGVTDLVTKYVWPVPAFHVTKACAKTGLTPNMVTTIGAVLMVLALYLFWEGQYGLGLLAGWVMTFLDTVDGKLARVTLTSSKWGNIFDHGIDLLHPPFWYIAWGAGLTQYGAPLPEGWLGPALLIMGAAYVLGRVCEGYFIWRFGFHVHVWRKVDSFFRLIVARRNPNMIVMTIYWLAGRPEIALLFIVFWHVFAVFVHVVQILQAEIARARQKQLTSWLQV